MTTNRTIKITKNNNKILKNHLQLFYKKYNFKLSLNQLFSYYFLNYSKIKNINISKYKIDLNDINNNKNIIYITDSKIYNRLKKDSKKLKIKISNLVNYIIDYNKKAV